MSTTCTNTVSPDGKYIIQKIVGEINAEIALDLNRETHALGRRLGIRCYLSDLTECRNTDSIVDNYDFAYIDMPADPGIDRFARVAVRRAGKAHTQNAGMSHTFGEGSAVKEL